MESVQFQLHAELEQQHWWFTGRREIMRTLLSAVLPPVVPPSLVLDVGCGTGGNIAHLADAYRCLGVDVSGEAIANARRRFPNVEFIQGSAPGAIGERMTDVKCITLMDVLEHVPDDFELLSQLVAAVPPGTRFLITVPADLTLWSEHDVSFGHYRRYDLPRFRRVWEGLPVRCRLLSYFNSRLYPVVKAIRTWNRWRGGAFGKGHTDLTLPSPPVNRFLHGCFAGEAGALCRSLRNGGGTVYRRGVSLVAILEREAGPAAVRTRPADLLDYYNPATRQPFGMSNHE